MKNSKIKTFDEKKLRKALKYKKIASYILNGFIYSIWTFLLFVFLVYLIEGLKFIVTNQAYATAALAIATVILAIIAVISISAQAFMERKRNRIRYLERVIEEIYNPLLSYFKENPDIHFEKGVNAGILVARKEIDRILFNKRFLLEPPGGILKKFNGYFQKYKGENKMNYSGWAFELEEDVIYWRRFGIILFDYYKKHVNQYRKYINLEKLKLNEPDWHKVFYLDEVRDLEYII